LKPNEGCWNPGPSRKKEASLEGQWCRLAICTCFSYFLYFIFYLIATVGSAS
jgi:hypothetical protein